MSAPPPHEMVHQGTDASGAQEWRCPECGRHFVIRWPPDYDRLVLREGDGNATHFGRKGEVSLLRIQVAPVPDAPSGASDDDSWRRWLRENSIDWDGWVS